MIVVQSRRTAAEIQHRDRAASPDQARNLTQVKAAKLIGISQPGLSHLLRGDYNDYSAERLMKMLTVFEQDIEIVMRPHRKAGEPGRITFKPVAA